MSLEYFVLMALFQSTLPMKGATINSLPLRFQNPVSIHAPNEGSDYCVS